MITTTFLALGAAVCLDAAPTTHESRFTIHPSRVDSTYRALYDSAQTFADFVSKATARKEQWEGNYSKGVAPDALVTRAAAAGTGWKLLVVTVPGCSDSVNIVPYVASLLDKVPSVEMRLISPAAGKAVQEAHRTPDGRAAMERLRLPRGTLATYRHFEEVQPIGRLGHCVYVRRYPARDRA